MPIYEGTSGNDTLVALTSVPNSLYGRAGNDLLIGAGGNDYLYGGTGNDTLNGGAGNDHLYGGGAAGDRDVLRYSLGADIFHGGLGWDIVDYRLAPSAVKAVWNGNIGSGGAAAGDVYSFDKINSLDGLFGSNFNDTLGGSAWANEIRGGKGQDWIRGFSGNDKLFGGAGNDILDGGTGKDTLEGGANHDYLYGGSKNDLLKGEGGNDELWGGEETIAWMAAKDTTRLSPALDPIASTVAPVALTISTL